MTDQAEEILFTNLQEAATLATTFVENPLKLMPGQKYTVVKSFTDYYHIVHEVDETWTFVRTNFSPYDDGLTLHVLQENISTEMIYRLQ